MLCHTEDEDGNRFTDDDIVNHMIFLMMAAHDTSTSTATTMVYHLAANPEWQERCRDESDRLGDGPLDIEALEKLETLDLVMNESIRMVTPVQWAMRQTVRDTDLLGHYLPAGTNVVAYPGMNHRLPELWTDPEKFDPARFAEPRNEHKKHRYAFTPFGGGAHKCIGMVFGQLEVKTIMHRLLRKYRLELPYPATSRAGTTAACRFRWTACRSCCARCTDPRDQAAVNRFAHAITARSADWVASAAQPIAHSARAPLLPWMKVAVCCPDGNWWNFSISTATPLSWSIAVSAATGPPPRPRWRCGHRRRWWPGSYAPAGPAGWRGARRRCIPVPQPQRAGRGAYVEKARRSSRRPPRAVPGATARRSGPRTAAGCADGRLVSDRGIMCRSSLIRGIDRRCSLTHSGGSVWIRPRCGLLLRVASARPPR